MHAMDNLPPHFSKRRMDVKKEGPVDVVASHLSKVCLIPAETQNTSHGEQTAHHTIRC